MNQTLDHFTGQRFRRGDSGYEARRYQYAFSSHSVDGHMEPAQILYPACKEDVRLALAFAAQRSLAVAVRTGGHNYVGASSTSGPNLLIDLRDAFGEFEWSADQQTVRAGVSLTLKDFNAKLGARGRFIPHGQCSHVRLGGHVQTGGYGMSARSFGLLSDHIEALELITADGRERVVRRGAEDPDDRELFFAVLGGCPGAFGVLTHVILRPLFDRDHPDSRGLKFFQVYSRQRLQSLLEVVVDVARDEELARDFDLSVTVLGGSQLRLPFVASPGIDERIRVAHPDIYGRDEHLALPAGIIVYAQWANTEGAGQVFDRTLFDRLRAAADYGAAPSATGLSRLTDGLRWRSMLEYLENRLHLGPTRLGLSGDRPMAMSELARNWVFLNVREFNLPYVKRAYLTASRDLQRTRWASWVSDRFDALVDPDNGCKGFLQVQHLGGRHSMFCQRGAEGTTAHSWRADTTLCCVIDAFYAEHGPYATPPRQLALAWQQQNDAESIGRGIFSREDRRVFWGPHGSMDLSSVWQHYYDSREKYERLRAIKARLDPAGVLSPNAFVLRGLEPSESR